MYTATATTATNTAATTPQCRAWPLIKGNIRRRRWRDARTRNRCNPPRTASSATEIPLCAPHKFSFNSTARRQSTSLTPPPPIPLPSGEGATRPAIINVVVVLQDLLSSVRISFLFYILYVYYEDRTFITRHKCVFQMCVTYDHRCNCSKWRFVAKKLKTIRHLCHAVLRYYTNIQSNIRPGVCRNECRRIKMALRVLSYIYTSCSIM